MTTTATTEVQATGRKRKSPSSSLPSRRSARLSNEQPAPGDKAQHWPGHRAPHHWQSQLLSHWQTGPLGSHYLVGLSYRIEPSESQARRKPARCQLPSWSPCWLAASVLPASTVLPLIRSSSANITLPQGRAKSFVLRLMTCRPLGAGKQFPPLYTVTIINPQSRSSFQKGTRPTVRVHWH